MLFLEDTPNTVAYMVAGYAVLLGLPILYVLSWIFRRSSLKRELDLLKAMQAEKEAETKTKKNSA